LGKKTTPPNNQKTPNPDPQKNIGIFYKQKIFLKKKKKKHQQKKKL
jgi:hypothetical protein